MKTIRGEYGEIFRVGMRYKLVHLQMDTDMLSEHVEHVFADLTPDQARALAAALVEQADAIEQTATKPPNKRSPHGDVLYFVGCNPVDGVLYKTSNPNGKIMTCTPEHWDALADADGGGK